MASKADKSEPKTHCDQGIEINKLHPRRPSTDNERKFKPVRDETDSVTNEPIATVNDKDSSKTQLQVKQTHNSKMCNASDEIIVGLTVNSTSGTKSVISDVSVLNDNSPNNTTQGDKSYMPAITRKDDKLIETNKRNESIIIESKNKQFTRKALESPNIEHANNLEKENVDSYKEMSFINDYDNTAETLSATNILESQLDIKPLDQSTINLLDTSHLYSKELIRETDAFNVESVKEKVEHTSVNGKTAVTRRVTKEQLDETITKSDQSEYVQDEANVNDSSTFDTVTNKESISEIVRHTPFVTNNEALHDLVDENIVEISFDYESDDFDIYQSKTEITSDKETSDENITEGMSKEIKQPCLTVNSSTSGNIKTGVENTNGNDKALRNIRLKHQLSEIDSSDILKVAFSDILNSKMDDESEESDQTNKNNRLVNLNASDIDQFPTENEMHEAFSQKYIKHQIQEANKAIDDFLNFKQTFNINNYLDQNHASSHASKKRIHSSEDCQPTKRVKTNEELNVPYMHLPVDKTSTKSESSNSNFECGPPIAIISPLGFNESNGNAVDSLDAAPQTRSSSSSLKDTPKSNEYNNQLLKSGIASVNVNEILDQKGKQNQFSDYMVGDVDLQLQHKFTDKEIFQTSDGNNWTFFGMDSQPQKPKLDSETILKECSSRNKLSPFTNALDNDGSKNSEISKSTNNFDVAANNKTQERKINAQKSNDVHKTIDVHLVNKDVGATALVELLTQEKGNSVSGAASCVSGHVDTGLSSRIINQRVTAKIGVEGISAEKITLSDLLKDEPKTDNNGFSLDINAISRPKDTRMDVCTQDLEQQLKSPLSGSQERNRMMWEMRNKPNLHNQTRVSTVFPVPHNSAQPSINYNAENVASGAFELNMPGVQSAMADVKPICGPGGVIAKSGQNSLALAEQAKARVTLHHTNQTMHQINDPAGANIISNQNVQQLHGPTAARRFSQAAVHGSHDPKDMNIVHQMMSKLPEYPAVLNKMKVNTGLPNNRYDYSAHFSGTGGVNMPYDAVNSRERVANPLTGQPFNGISSAIHSQRSALVRENFYVQNQIPNTVTHETGQYRDNHLNRIQIQNKSHPHGLSHMNSEQWQNTANQNIKHQWLQRPSPNQAIPNLHYPTSQGQLPGQANQRNMQYSIGSQQESNVPIQSRINPMDFRNPENQHFNHHLKERHVQSAANQNAMQYQLYQRNAINPNSSHQMRGNQTMQSMYGNQPVQQQMHNRASNTQMQYQMNMNKTVQAGNQREIFIDTNQSATGSRRGVFNEHNYPGMSNTAHGQMLPSSILPQTSGTSGLLQIPPSNRDTAVTMEPNPNGNRQQYARSSSVTPDNAFTEYHLDNGPIETMIEQYIS